MMYILNNHSRSTQKNENSHVPNIKKSNTSKWLKISGDDQDRFYVKCLEIMGEL